MSHINPAPDIKYLYNIIGKEGKKNLKTEEFQKRKLMSIVKSIAIDDSIQAQCEKASVEAYYNHYDMAVGTLKNVLKLTHNQSYLAWERLLKLYIETANIEAFIATYRLVLEQQFENTEELDGLFRYMQATYLITDLYDDALLSLKLNEFDKYKVDKRIQIIHKFGISLPIYRKFISIFYQEFYTYYEGRTQFILHPNTQDLIIRVHTSINNAEDIFEFNNHLQDVIMAWYAEANEEDQQQIEKVVIYVEQSVVFTKENGIVA